MCPLSHFLCCKIGPLDRGNIMCDIMFLEEAFVNLKWRCCWRHYEEERQISSKAGVKSGKNTYSSI